MTRIPTVSLHRTSTTNAGVRLVSRTYSARFCGLQLHFMCFLFSSRLFFLVICIRVIGASADAYTHGSITLCFWVSEGCGFILLRITSLQRDQLEVLAFVFLLRVCMGESMHVLTFSASCGHFILFERFLLLFEHFLVACFTACFGLFSLFQLCVSSVVQSSQCLIHVRRCEKHLGS